MTLSFPQAKVPTRDLVADTEQMCREVAEELLQAIRDVRDGKLGDAKTATQAIRDLRTAFQMAMEERTRVEKHRKEESGIVHNYALDFDDARSEIGRRLACLRDAGRG